MYRLERNDFVKTPIVYLWSTLGFQAGFINAFGFLACGRYVSHVTGFGTQTGVALADGLGWFAVELAGVPLSFIAGAFACGLATSARLERGERPFYNQIVMLLPIFMLFLAVMGLNGMFGPFGELLVLPRDFLLLYLLSFLCGMQNACFATLTKGQIRTTHLTGISTDIGTDLARLVRGRLSPEEKNLTRKVNYSRMLTFIGFTFGSISSVLVARQLGYGALVIPIFTSIVAFFWVRGVERRLDLIYGPRSASTAASLSAVVVAAFLSMPGAYASESETPPPAASPTPSAAQNNADDVAAQQKAKAERQKWLRQQARLNRIEKRPRSKNQN